jgi:hypothetical protein
MQASLQFDADIRTERVRRNTKGERQVALKNLVKEAVEGAVGSTIAGEVQEIVAKETRRALRERKDELTALVRAVVASAIAEMLNGHDEAPSR